MTLADLAEITDRDGLFKACWGIPQRATAELLADLILENRELRAAIMDADADLTRYLEAQRQLVARVERLECLAQRGRIPQDMIGVL